MEKKLNQDIPGYDSISVSPQKYDPSIPLEIYGDPIVASLPAFISSILPDDYLSLSEKD